MGDGGGVVSGGEAAILRGEAVSTTTRWREWAREIFLSPSWTPKITKAIPSTFFPYKNLRDKETWGPGDVSGCG